MLKYSGADLEFSLRGQTAIITGGAAGIGFETAKFFIAKGVNCVLADLNLDVDKIAGKLGVNCLGISGDVTKADYIKSVIDLAVSKFGGLDILVNCAGIVALDNAETISDEAWQRTININLTASFKMAQAVGKYMIDAGRGGSIVNMASQAGVIALDKHVAYAASKGGIIAMTKVMAYEWGEYGIRVNAVSPTVVLTDLGKKAWSGPVGDAFKKEMPSGRFAETDEIAGTIGFLCSGAAGMITGHNLLVDGGYTIK
jgi:NAD(P)-dependent dehydrogenase (short-subunit alcohol dehydrogenase family)